MWLTDVAIKRPVFITMVFLALIVLGFRSVTLMAVDQYPKIDIPIVTVVTTYPGAGPEEMETLVTKVIEDQVSTVNKLDELTSISRDSVSTVVIRFLLEADLDAATADVRDKVQLAKPQLPDDVEEPQIIKVDLGSMPVLTFGLTSDSMDVRTLKRLVDQVIADRITKLSGVGDVQVSGGETREILVELDQKRLIAYSITIAEIQQALKTGNINIPSGNIKHESKENVIRVFGEFQSVDEIANLRITKRKSNGTITSFVLSDVAKITDGSADREDFTRINRTDSVGLTVRKQSDANTLKVVEIVKKELKNIEKDYPEINFNISDDQSIYIHSSLEEVRTHLFLGGLLAIFIVFLFLHDIRGTFIIASALPTSMISTFIILFAANQTLNMMSLMGLALCTGILIDDSIVVLENIHRHLKMGKEPKVAALEGRSEIGLAAIAITTVDVVVFLPIAFMGGIVGRFFFSFGLTVATATLFSLFVSFTLTPMLASQWFKKETEEKKKESNFYPLVFMRSLWNGFFGAFDYGYNTLDTFYRRVLEVALKVRWLVVLIGIGSLIIVIRFIAPLLGFEFMPNSDQGKVLVRLELPSDVNVDETDRFVKKIEEIVSNKQDFPEIKSVFAQIGVQKGHFGSGNQGSQYAEITLDIGQKHTRKRSDNEIRRAILEKVIDIPYRVTVVTVSGMGGSEAPLQIQITGSKYQMDDILDISYKVTKIVETTPGTMDIDTSWKEGKPETRVVADRLKMAHMGFSVATIGSIVRTSIEGNNDVKYREGGEEYDIRIRLQEKDRKEPEQVGDIYIGSKDNNPVFIKNIASLKESPSPNKIDHYNKQRVVTISAELARGYPLGNVKRAIEKRLKEEIVTPPGISFTFGGASKRMVESFGYLFQALILAIVLVYMVMSALFESYLNPFIIMFALPQALVGGLLALFLTGKTINMFSMIGVIMLMGLVAKNGILLIDYTNTLREKGIERDEAIKQAGPTRLRPILMTTAAMVFGMMPIALGLGAGSETRSPMAICVIGGLILSTLLTLLLIPVLYAQFDDLMNFMGRVKRSILGE